MKSRRRINVNCRDLVAIAIATAFTGSLALAQIPLSITNYPVPFTGSHPQAITTGPDNALWFTDPGTNSIGRIAPSGTSFAITEYTIPTALNIGGQTFTIQQQEGPSLSNNLVGVPAPFNFVPHLAAEGGWRTTFTLVNLDTTAANTSTVLYGNDGNLLNLPLTFPQQSSQTPVTEAWVNQNLAPNQFLIFEASGPASAPFTEGSAQLWAVNNVSGFSIFHYDPSGQEAVVPLGGSGYVIPFDNTSDVSTGIAMESTTPFEYTFPVTLLNDAGVAIGTGKESITLPGYGHTSFVLSTQFPVTANLRGSVILGNCSYVSNPGPGYPSQSCTPISTLGIRYTPPGTLTTISSLNASTGAPALFPHIASGDGWETTFVLVNTFTAALQAQLTFLENNGNPLTLPLTFPQTGATSIASTVAQTIAPGASLWIQTSGDLTTALLTGSAQLTGVSGFAIFRYLPNGQEAVVPLGTGNANSYVLAFDNTGGTVTGVAISDISSVVPTPASAQINVVTIPLAATIVPVTLRDDTGAQIGIGGVGLALNGHASFMLDAQFPATAGIRGTIEFDAPLDAQISALGIRSPPALTFTTLPALAK